MARLMLPFMAYAKGDWLQVLNSSIKGVLELVDPTKALRRNKYLDFLVNYFKLGEEQWEMYRSYKQKKNEVKKVDMVRNIFEQKRFEGEIKEGRQTLLLLLPQKFGPMPPEIEGSIRQLTDLDRIHSILTQFMKVSDWHEIRQLLNGPN